MPVRQTSEIKTFSREGLKKSLEVVMMKEHLNPLGTGIPHEHTVSDMHARTCMHAHMCTRIRTLQRCVSVFLVDQN